MIRAVLDSTVLVSAFLGPGGVSDALLEQAHADRFSLHLAEEILAETRCILLDTERIRRRYTYSDDSAHRFIEELRDIANLIGPLPPLTGMVERDPNDDMIIACASAASAGYIVTRDDDLLSLRAYDSITMVTPEVFMATLQSQ
ncbi:MAG: putative toxin-antitoxin system toxin component, PIN family [Candidatus Tectomicrobia bacterium]|nr:putative toxin-antitoxin system toxin component, PIN family [Candidatus Tectomicrobia bacterium]